MRRHVRCRRQKESKRSRFGHVAPLRVPNFKPKVCGGAMKIIMVLPNIIPHGCYVTSGEEAPNATAAGKPVSQSG